MYVQSKRTDGPPHKNRIPAMYWLDVIVTKMNLFPNLQQPEGRPCRDEPWSQEADAREVSKHVQVRGHQWAADEVRFLCRYNSDNPVAKGHYVLSSL